MKKNSDLGDVHKNTTESPPTMVICATTSGGPGHPWKRLDEMEMRGGAMWRWWAERVEVRSEKLRWWVFFSANCLDTKKITPEIGVDDPNLQDSFFFFSWVELHDPAEISKDFLLAFCFFESIFWGP